MVANAREVELDATKIAHGGIVVARHEGRVVFVADAIPGERVLARVTDERSRFWRAETVRVIEPSPDRVPHFWAEASVERDPADRAGGAEFGHIAPARQRALKSEVLTEALARFARIECDVEVQAVPGESEGSGWRTRVRLHVAPDGTVGPYASRSRRVIPVASLPLAVPAIRELAPRTAAPGQRAIALVAPSADDARVVGQGGTIRERVDEREFVLDEGGFWQVHPEASRTLSRAVREAVGPELVDPDADNLDLYGGVGLLAAALGDLVGPELRITSVESDRRATAHARENLSDWAGARAETGRVEQWLTRRPAPSVIERERRRRATVILDPPRSGAGADVLAALAATEPAQLVYVACDPVALARDAGILAGLGYALTSIAAYDLFPATHHLETVAAFRREG